MKKRAAVFVAFLVVVGTLGSGSAQHQTEPPVLWSRPIQGNEWVALRFRIDAPGQYLIVRNEPARVAGSIYGVGLWMSGASSRSWVAGVQWTNASRTFVATDATGVLANRGEPALDEEFPFAPTVYSESPSPGEYTAVMIATVDGTMEGVFELRGTDGITVLGATTGPAAIVHDEDFGGAAHARTSEELVDLPFVGCVACPRAQATALANCDLDVSGLLYGWYDLGERGSAGYTGPAGTGPADGFLSGEPPGRYRFFIDATVSTTPMWLMMGDVILPE